MRPADTISDAAIRNRLESSECVTVFSHPTTVGLTKPARLPVALINAMPAAAPVPPRKDVGNAQNMGKAVITPEAASVKRQAKQRDIRIVARIRAQHETRCRHALGQHDVPAAFTRAVSMAADYDHRDQGGKIRHDREQPDGESVRDARTLDDGRLPEANRVRAHHDTE